MYIVNDIAYAGRPRGELKVSALRILDDLYMMVTFSSGERRLFDASYLLQYPAYAPLADPTVFQTAKVEHGLIIWANGAIDIAPENVYERSFPYNGKSIHSA